MPESIESQLETLIKARYTLLWLQSHEEERVTIMLSRIAITLNKHLQVWSNTTGLREPKPDGKWASVKDGTDDPLSALETIEASEKQVIVVFKDMHRFLEGNPMVYRKLRDLHENLKATRKTIIILSPVVSIPVELQKAITVLNVPFPAKDELELVLKASIRTIKGLAETGDKNAKEVCEKITEQLNTNGTKENVLGAGLGLTLNEFEDVVMKSIVKTHSLDASVIVAEKEQIIKKSGILEFYQSLVSMQDVGGLEKLKDWIQKRKLAFSKKAEEFGLRTPKGAFLAGLPGTGKSLISKVSAKYMDMPLLRLDVSKIFASHVGESEQNISNALKLADAVAPCVTGNTCILLGDGTLTNARQLYEKTQLAERIVAIEENTKQAYSVPLLGVIKKPTSKIVKIVATATVLSATKNHKIMTQDGWMEVGTIKKGDWLYLPTLKTNTKEGRIRISDIMPEEAMQIEPTKWRMGRGGWTDSILTINTEELTEEFGELLGYIDSDGSMRQRRVSFYNSNKILLDRFEELMMKLFNLHARRILNSNQPGDIKIKSNGEAITTRKVQYVTYVNSSLLVRLLNKVQANMLNFNFNKLVSAYLRAFINGDGHIDIRQGKISISQKGEDKQRFLQELLRRVGVYGRFREGNEITLSGEMARRLLKTLQKASGAKEDKISKAFFSENEYSHVNGRSIRIAENGVYTKVESVTEIPEEEVYDLSCLGIHNYVSNGVVSHNCVLWVDEVEKALSGVQSSGSLDSGVTSRIFGTLLTWMQEHESQVFVIATCNNPQAIPPEFMRAGRFDEVFFVDLPSKKEREEIFRIHISKVKRNAEDFNIEYFASITDGFSGAEIEYVVQNALYNAFYDNSDLSNDYITSAIHATTPLSKKRQAELDALRRWGKENAVNASAVAIGKSGIGKREVDL